MAPAIVDVDSIQHYLFSNPYDQSSLIKLDYGRRLLPQVVDDRARWQPERIWASIARSTASDGFLDITIKELAQAVNFMSWWLEARIGRSATNQIEAISYIGAPDVRYGVMFLAAIKCGYKYLVPSNRNSQSGNVHLIKVTKAKCIFSSIESSAKVHEIALEANVKEHVIPTLEEMLEVTAKYYPYEDSFERVQDDPCLICHTSGSTGFPKPIDITHAAMAVYDNQRLLPAIGKRRNLGYNLYAGHVFYTAFPPYHLAGICGLVTTPVFYHDSTVILPAPDMPNNGSTACEVLRRSNGSITAMLSPPTVVEQLEHEPGGKQQAAGLGHLVSAGGPLGPSAGNSLAEVTDICQFIGSTEIGTIPVFLPAREDWSYFEWHPVYGVKMELISSDALGRIYEAVLPWDDKVDSDTMIRRVCRDSSIDKKAEWRTKDLYRPHATKPNLWKFHGRTDDIIVLSNGEKFNPVTMEGIIQGHPLLSGAVIVGQARFQAALIIEAKPSTDIQDRDKIIDEVWSIIKRANTEGPDHARIYRSKIIVASREKPFQRVGKGTIIREQIIQAYDGEIDAVYSDESSSMPDESRVPKLRSVDDLDHVRAFVRACLLSVFETSKDSSQTDGSQSLSDQDDFFVHGLDSLQTVELSHCLRAGLRSSAAGDLSWLSSKTIYANPTTEALSRSLISRLTSGAESLDEADESHRIARMSAMVEKYIDGLPRRSAQSQQNSDDVGRDKALTVILTGSTGTLGINILQILLEDPKIAKVYCLNRAADARQRLDANFADRGVEPKFNLSKAEFLQSDFGDAHLGLTSDKYAALLASTNAIIHNAWAVNFNQTLESFETTHIRGIRNMINLSLASTHHAHIHFVSSLSSVGNWTAYNPAPVTETPLTSYGVAQKLGYGESKHVAERILQLAHSRSAVAVNILRVGQVAGPSAADGTEWHRHEWLPSLVKTSKTLRKIPETLTVVDWVTVDAMAAIVVDLVHSGVEQQSSYLRIFNLLNPKTAQWKEMADAVQEWFRPGSDIATTPFTEWVKEVEATDMGNTEEVAAKPAAKIVDFYTALADAGAPPDHAKSNFETDNGTRYSRTFAELKPVDSELMRTWLKRWDF